MGPSRPPRAQVGPWSRPTLAVELIVLTFDCQVPPLRCLREWLLSVSCRQEIPAAVQKETSSTSSSPVLCFWKELNALYVFCQSTIDDFCKHLACFRVALLDASSSRTFLCFCGWRMPPPARGHKPESLDRKNYDFEHGTTVHSAVPLTAVKWHWPSQDINP